MDCLIYFTISREQGTTLTRLTLASPPAKQPASPPLNPKPPDPPHFSRLHRFHATWQTCSKSYSSLTAAMMNPGPVSNCALHPVILLIPAGPANRGRQCSLFSLPVAFDCHPPDPGN